MKNEIKLIQGRNMKRLFVFLTILSIATPANAQISASCGIAPLKPMTCMNGHWVCNCDQHGQCSWVLGTVQRTV